MTYVWAYEGAPVTRKVAIPFSEIASVHVLRGGEEGYCHVTTKTLAWEFYLRCTPRQLIEAMTSGEPLVLAPWETARKEENGVQG